MYSILIDTYIKDSEQKLKLFKSMENFPCISKKASWAQKWMGDKRSSFASRLIAFACVEGIFFSSSFASIYWIKKRGLMPGLTLSNEFISRDEALHTEFAILLYSKLNKKVNKKRVAEIITEATEIEKEFITEALPCRLIGMNAKLMTQYIEFVADRLSVKYGIKMAHGNKEGMTNATIDIGELYENFTDEEKKYLKGVAEGNEIGLEGLTGNDEVIYESIIDYIKDKPNDEGENDDEETNDEDEIEEDDTGDAEGMRNKGKSGKKSKKKKKPKTIEGLEEEAQKLIKTQQNLKNNMEALEPMLKQAEKFMSQFEKTKK